MKDYLKILPEDLKKIINLVSEVAAKLNTTAYLVGGCVRDLILGVKNLDLDIVVENNGIGFAEELSRCIGSRLTVHKMFGTATLKFQESFKIDIATARRESYPVAGCLPKVESGTLRDDLARRDFTINAMAIDITGGNLGNFIDFFNGSGDLRNRKIRVLHNLSFIDDPTRMLRAIRFEQRYDFNIEPHTLQLLKESVRNKMLRKISGHRAAEELALILKEARPIKYIKRIKKLIGFDFVLENLAVDKKTFQFLKDTQKQVVWFNHIHSRRRSLDSWLMFLIVLLEPLNIKDTERVSENFGLRQGDKKRILSFKKITVSFISKLKKSSVRPAEIFHLLEPLSYEVILLARAKFKNQNINKHTQEFFQIYNDIRISASGEDLKKLGLLPGPAYQKIFSRVLNARLNGTISNHKQEIELIKSIIGKV